MRWHAVQVTVRSGDAGAELSTWLDAMRELSAAAASAADLGQLLGQVAATARSLLGFDFCGVLVPDTDGARLVVAGWSGLSDEYVRRVNGDRPINLDSGAPSSRAFHGAHPVAIRDIAAEPDFSPWGGAAQEQGYRAIVCVPLIAAGCTLGTLNGYYKPAHTFAPFEIERLTLLANHAAIALTSADRLEQLRQLNDELREQRDALARSEEIHNTLLAVTLRSGGLAGVAAALADLIDRPVLIEDPLHEVLATAGDRGRLPGAALRARCGVLEAHTSRPARIVDGEDDFQVSSPELDGELVARIWFPAGGLEPDSMMVRAVEHASMVVSLELLRIRTEAEVEQRLRGELLSEVLSATADLDDAVLRRAQLLGHDLGQPHDVIVARINRLPVQSESLLRQRAFTLVAGLAARHRPRPLVATMRDDIVVLWPHDEIAGEPDVPASTHAVTIHAAIVSAAEGMHATVSVAATDGGGYRETYRTVKGALAIAVAAQKLNAVVKLDDLGVAGLLLQLDDPALLSAFAARTLGPLQNYDNAHGTRLIHTIRTYLGCNQDRKRAAAALHIHPNTLTQRLQRIETLCTTPLSDPSTILQLVTALTVDDVAAQGR